eukprot:COSAG06_NODE_28395_length_575_cov_0.861345_1_plen_47_part_01
MNERMDRMVAGERTWDGEPAALAYDRYNNRPHARTHGLYKSNAVFTR